MGIDFSNQDDYWDTVVAGSVSKKKKRGLTTRTLADVGVNYVRWLDEESRDDYYSGGLDKQIKREFTHRYEDTPTAKLIDETWSCSKRDVSYESHLLAQALLKIKVESTFGFTFIVNSLRLPLDVSQSYFTFYNKGEITGVMTLEAVAKILGIATIGLTIEGSIDASLTVVGTIETKLDIAKWEVIRQVVPDGDDDAYKTKDIGEGDTSVNRTGDFEGIKRPDFYAGIAVQVDPAAAAVVGEASVMAKLTAGVSNNVVFPFTYGLDVGWNKAIITAGTCPDLGPIPSKRDLGLVEAAGNYSLGYRHGHSLPSGLDDNNGIQQRPGQLAKRGSVYSPVLSLPAGKFFCPPSNYPNENEGSSRGDVQPAWDQDKYLNEDYENMRRRRSENATNLDDYDDLDDVVGEILAHIDKRAIIQKTPGVCGSYDWGDPLTARVANTDYHSVHILEAQMMDKFFTIYINEKTDLLVNSNPNPRQNKARVSFCGYVGMMFNIPAVAAPGIDTAQGFGVTLTPNDHIAAQFPTHQWKTDEYVSLK
ncbi:hypothetical protein MFIFM68171_11326 [Madurella fahalii]|uniref:Uncharacterized protein n=1 Tax=Madurella fahalii TaxID=1157608 RepID=A0ABQ0GTP5_9PEZI